MTETVLIEYKNEAYIKINCEKGILQEMSDFFTFFVPGYQFMPAFRNKIWDGKLRLLNANTRLIYRGLLPYVVKFCEDHDYPIVLGDTRTSLDRLTPEQCDAFVDKLKLQSRSKDIECRDYQKAAFLTAINEKRRLLLSPTASGKSLIIYMIVRFLLNNGCKKGLLIVPTTSLVEQMYTDFEDYSTKNGWRVDDNIHRIYAGREKVSEYPLTVSTWQSLYTQDPSYFEQFDFVIGDEAHLFKANSLTGIMDKAINARYRIGTTGTLDGTKTHKLVLEGIFGPVMKVTTTREMMDSKQAAELKIKCLVLKYPVETCKTLKGSTYPDEMDFLIAHEGRNKFIRNLSVSLKGNTLILYQFVDKHGKKLYDLITESVKGTSRKVFFVYGKTDTEIREDIRAIVEKETDAIIIASYGTFSTGINIRNLLNIVFASPSKSRVRNLQSIGRSLRLGDGKWYATLYDIADDLRHKEGAAMNHTLDHFVQRTKIYNEEQFDYKIVNIEMKT